MHRKLQIALGIFNLILFAVIITAEVIDLREFGLSKGEVVEVQNNGNTCFGPEHEFDAQVLLDFYRDFNLTTSTTYLSNHLQKGEKVLFVYWGHKKDIESPLESLDDPQQYYSSVQIALFSCESWVAWYYVIYQACKWLFVITGVILLIPWKMRGTK